MVSCKFVEHLVYDNSSILPPPFEVGVLIAILRGRKPKLRQVTKLIWGQIARWWANWGMDLRSNWIRCSCFLLMLHLWYSNAIVLNQWQFGPAGDVGQCLETFLFVTAGDSYRQLVSGDRGRCWRFYSAQGSHHSEELSNSNVNNTKVEKSCSEGNRGSCAV